MQIHRGRAFLKPHKEHGGLRRGLRHHRSARTSLPNYATRRLPVQSILTVESLLRRTGRLPCSRIVYPPDVP